MADAIRLDLANTPEKFRPTVDEILSQLTEFLEELGRLEDQYFVQRKESLWQRVCSDCMLRESRRRKLR